MNAPNNQPKRIFLLGGTGTIGRAVLDALTARGHEVVAFVRDDKNIKVEFPNVIYRTGDVTELGSIAQDGLCGETFDALVSCLASRSGAPDDAWAIDHHAHMHALAAAQSAMIPHFVLLSAICVQKPMLAFQHAKLAFEKTLIESGLSYSIVRPTAFFKSLSGQVARVKKGKSFLLFGDGELTSCKPISEADLANFICDCVNNPELRNQVLPIGGPGDAITPKQQGEMLFELLHQEPRFKHVPVKILDFVIGALGVFGHVLSAAARKAELARIGRYYATESMLVWDADKQQYDAAATPSVGTETLRERYRRILSGEAIAERGEHSVF